VGRDDLERVRQTFRLVRPDALDESAESLAVHLVRSTALRLGEIDALIEARSEHWRLERMPVVDRAILRMAIGEFLSSPDTPRTVVINEALELARTFSTEDAVRFINGVLDAINHDLAAAGGPRA
jgi:N utilization substance protein B